MREEAFWEWYKVYNPEMNPESDDMIDELRSCWFTAWERSVEMGQILQELSDIGQEIDNGQPKP